MAFLDPARPQYKPQSPAPYPWLSTLPFLRPFNRIAKSSHSFSHFWRETIDSVRNTRVYIVQATVLCDLIVENQPDAGETRCYWVHRE